MRYCQECAAEVQPADTFCSYCGVALQPFSPASETAENEIGEPVEIAEITAQKEDTTFVEEDTQVANSDADAKTPHEQNASRGLDFNAPDLEQPQVVNDEQNIPNEPIISVRSNNISEVSITSYSSVNFPKFVNVETPAENVENVETADTVDEFDYEPQTVVKAADETPIETDTQTSAPKPDENIQANDGTAKEPVEKQDLPPNDELNAVSNDESAKSFDEEPETVFSSTPFIPVIERRDLHQTENPLQINELNAAAFDYDREFGDEPFELLARDDSQELKETAETAETDETDEKQPPEKTVEQQKASSNYDEDLPPTLIGHGFDFSEAVALRKNAENAPDVVENVDDVVNEEVLREDSLSNFSLNADEVADIEKAESSKQSSGLFGEKNSPLGTLSGKQAEIERKPARQTDANRLSETPSDKNSKLKPLVEGTVLNRRYEIVRRIGGGGMGAVYLASDHNLGGVLRAVKEMIQAYVDESQQEKAVQDFRRESLLLTSLEHPAIPTIYDYFYDENNGRFYLVMKYISGGDLSARLRAAPDGKIDERNITEWAIQIADVLDYLHNRQPPIVYRDLKPANIMLDGNTGRAMLIDFGIARWVNKEEKGVTAVGTMGYAPPELFSGNAEPRSDIYSLGATMFHLLTGADPQNQPLLIFDFTKNPKPTVINPALSIEMEDILCRAVEYNAVLRFSSAAEMRETLLLHLDKLRGGKLNYKQQTASNSAVVSSPVVANAANVSSQVFCSSCGTKIMLSDVFCPFCGAQQPAGQKSAPNAAPLGKVTAKLIVLGTAEFNAPAFVLEKDTNLVGREDRRSNIFPEVDLTKYDGQAKISRRHARIWRQGANFMVEDLKSSNGTTVISNDEKNVRLEPFKPRILSNGDKVKIGETTLHFFIN
ncbi:MAG: protein kinase [Pyrinomonadaceae bacterium]|nr:protein kinase [Pyrinomonadaceae bacterium]